MADRGKCFILRIQSDLSHIKEFLMENQKIINAHNVDFFTKNLWESCLSKGIREDLDKLTEDEISLLPSVFVDGIENPEECSAGTLKQCRNLLELFSQVRNIHLRNFLHVKQGKYFNGVIDTGNHPLSSFMMSPKKSYEVGVMSQAVYDLVQSTTATKVVDLGSGKGYLSQHLALKHGIPVVGIDSSDSNTKNAERRNEKTLKVWHYLIKRSQNFSLEDTSNQCPIDNAMTCRNRNTCTSSVLQESDIDGPSSENSLSFKPLITHMSASSTCSNMDHASSVTQLSTCHSMKQKEIHSSLLIPEKERCHNKEFQTLSSSASTESTKHNSYLPVTAHVSSSAQIYQNLGGLFDNKCAKQEFNTDEQEGLILVGLHTCGDLAPTAIKIFIKDSFVKALCLVGCCYHLLSQSLTCKTEIETEQNSQISQGVEADTDYGFPMSDFLKQQNFTVSRNATMVAQQAADRIASEHKVILKEKFGLDTTGMHVGRVGRKCKTFADYVYKAFKKLGLENKMISDEEIQTFFQRFQEKERQITAFHQLRACIAPCIESLFLMDRLCYLHEKGIDDAKIVAMFDPVKSPRCYAIIASKTS